MCLLSREEATSKQLIQLSFVFFSSVYSCRVNWCDRRDQHFHTIWSEELYSD